MIGKKRAENDQSGVFGEEFSIFAGAGIAFDRSNANMATPLINEREQEYKEKILIFLLCLFY